MRRFKQFRDFGVASLARARAAAAAAASPVKPAKAQSGRSRGRAKLFFYRHDRAHRLLNARSENLKPNISLPCPWEVVRDTRHLYTTVLTLGGACELVHEGPQ